MYHRISKKSFDRYIERVSKEQKLTKNQLAWEYQAYLLNNRLAAAEKRGYVFNENVIPERPSRVTKKALSGLEKIKGDVALFDVAEYVNLENINKRAQDRLFKKYGENGEAALAQLENGEVALINTKNAPELAPEETPVEQPTVPPEPPSPEEPEPEPIERYDPEEGFYGDGDRVSAGDEPLEQIDFTILNNIEDVLSRAHYVNDGDGKLFGRNRDIKYDAIEQAWNYLSGAIQEYGREEVAKRLQDAAENVTELAIAIAHWYYINSAGQTEANTNGRLHVLAEILFANDASAQMRYDFEDD